MKKHFFLSALAAMLTLLQISLFAQPTITSFAPSSGPIGTSVVISGTNFSATMANNTVFFGAVKASVTAATTTSLTVTVPAGATYQPITVMTAGLTAYSRLPFNVTFLGGGYLNSTSFDTKLSFTTGAGPNGVAICDIDGDGKSDLSVANWGLSSGTSFSVLRNTSTPANISFATKVDFTTLTAPGQITTGDIDGDGKPDVAISNGTSTLPNYLSVFHNTSTSGSISFGARQDFNVGNYGGRVFIRDIDMDGKPDLIINTQGVTSILRNTSTIGTISFATKTDFFSGTKDIDISDIDGDTKPDIIVDNFTSPSNTHQVSVFRNTSTSGSISFAAGSDFICSSNFAGTRVLISDVDADGSPDIAVSNDTDKLIYVFRNTSTTGVISLAAKINMATGSFPSDINTGDLDGDGLPDLTLEDGNPNYPSLRKNTTTGTSLSFASSVNLDYFNSTRVFNGDLDSDGRPEIIALDGGSSATTLAVYRNLMIPPTVSSFTPTSASGGSTVTITGTNFTGATAVSFGGTAATSFTVVSPTSITAVVASGTSGSVSVTTPGGTATKTGFTFIPIPTISSFTPTSTASGATVTITGTNFTGATAVSFGGTAASSFTVVSSTSITAVVASGTSGSVSVTTPNGTATKAGFTFIPAPTISSFSPTSVGSATSVTITGTNFSGATAVSFGGTAASSFTVVSSTSITAMVSNGSSGVVSVTTPGGIATKAGFIYISALTMSSFTPTSAGTGAIVTITGTNFTGATAVSFGGTAAGSFTVVSSTSITAVVAGGTSGSVSVTTPSGGTVTKPGFTFVPAPNISSISHTTAASGTTVTITGTNLSGATAVSFGGNAASSYTIVSATTITAVVGSGSSGNVSVTTLGGTATLSGFTFVPAPTYWSGAIPTSLAGRTDGVAIVINGKSYIGLGKNATGLLKDWWEFDPSTNGWTQKLDFPGNARIGAVAFVINGKGYVGTGNDQSGGGFKQDFYEYDATANSWTSKANFPADFNSGAGITAGVGFAVGNFGYVGLGNTGLNNSIAFYKFDPAANSWQSIADFPGSGRTGAIGFAANGFGYAGFGFGSLSPNRNDMWQYDPTLNKWTAKSSYSGAGRGGAAVAVINGNAFLFAGTENTTGSFGADVRTNAVISYSTSLDQWTTQLALPASVRTGAMAFSVNKTAYVFGGYNYASGNVYLSDLYSFTPPSTFLPADPTGTAATVQSLTQIQCSWVDNSDNENGFMIEYAVGNSSTFSFVATVPTNTTTYVHTGLTADTQYQYRITAINAYGNSQSIKTATVITTLPPAAPTNLSASALSTSSISLSWADNSSNETGFEIYRSVSNNSSYALIHTSAANGNGYTDNGLSSGTTYFYKIKAINAGGFSYSNEVSMATLWPTPTITSFTPTSSPGGNTVTIVGTNFTGATAVSFGGVAASSFSVSSSTVIYANVASGPSGASGSVSVTTPGGTASLAGFTFIYPPTISSFAPTAAASGTTVTITGTNLTGTTSVFFGSSAAGSFTVVSSTTITAVVVKGNNGSITVNAPGGTTSKTGFTFIPSTISSFSPASAGAGTVVTIFGNNLNGATAVNFGGANATSFTVVSSTTITAVVPANGASGGISVTTPGGTAILSGFTFVPALSITSFSPSVGGPGLPIVITGTNFTGATGVSFGGVAAKSFTVTSSNSITAVVDTGASGIISITSPGGTATISGFVYDQTITAVEPTSSTGDSEVEIFPNPSPRGEINFTLNKSWEGKTASIIITDLSGRTVYFGSINCKSINTVALGGSSALKAGLYIITVTSDQKNARAKVMVVD